MNRTRPASVRSPSEVCLGRAIARSPSEDSKMAQGLLDSAVSLGRAGVDAASGSPVMGWSEPEAAQLLDVRDPTCSRTETVVGVEPCANVAVGDCARGSGRV
jgi:hypothetical protein